MGGRLWYDSWSERLRYCRLILSQSVDCIRNFFSEPVSNQRFGIIGGGLIGLATAIKLQKKCPDAEVFIWEKEPLPGQHQSTHNSGVLHAGLYYKPGSLKARLAVQGIREMTAFCKEYGVKHDICGKVVVATDETELSRLDTLLDRGIANGLTGLEKISVEQLRELEPMAKGIAAVHVPEEGIVDYAQVVHACAELLKGAAAACVCRGRRGS